jgi:hypothetical protein
MQSHYIGTWRELKTGWQFLENGPDSREQAESRQDWKPLDFPWLTEGHIQQNTNFIWFRYVFPLSECPPSLCGQIIFKHVRWSADAWLNGVFMGGDIGDASLALDTGSSLRAGDNHVLVRVGTFKNVPRGKSGEPLFPIGSARYDWGTRDGGLSDSVWLHFYEKARIDRALVISHLEKNQIEVRLDVSCPTGENEIGALQIEAQVFPGGQVEAREITRPGMGAQTFFLSMPALAQRWTPDSPFLHQVQLVLKDPSGRILDTRAEIFGYREIEVRDGQINFNKERMFWRGGTLVFEYAKSPREKTTDPQFVKRWLVESCKDMNLNIVRTHTGLPPQMWFATADCGGMGIMAELPLCYNYADYKHEADDLEIFRKNVLDQYGRSIPNYWNHPCIFAWVPSNEPPQSVETWENDVLVPFVRKLDPSRPVTRAGGESEQFHDFHEYAGYWYVSDGMFYLRIWDRLRDYREKNHGKISKVVMNTEYMENMNPERAAHWLGDPRYLGKPINQHSEERQRAAALTYAEFASDQTEMMRREMFDGISCYALYAWMGKAWASAEGVAERPPIFYALKNAMAPVAVSLDIFNRNYSAGEMMDVPVQVMNDLTKPQQVHVRWRLLDKNPEYGMARFDPVVEGIAQTIIAPPSGKIGISTRLTLPAKSGIYHLQAIAQRQGAEAVHSQRVIRVVAPRVVPANASLDIIGQPERLLCFLKGRGWSAQDPHAATTVLWRDEDREALRNDWPRIEQKVRAGGRLLLFQSTPWNLEPFGSWGLREVEQGPFNWGDSHAAVPPAAASHWVFEGLSPEYFLRWNSPNGALALRTLRPVPAEATVLLEMKGKQDPYSPLLVKLPLGDGEVYLCTLALHNFLLPGEDTWNPWHKALLPGPRANLDPVAQRVLMNLLFGGQSAGNPAPEVR